MKQSQARMGELCPTQQAEYELFDVEESRDEIHHLKILFVTSIVGFGLALGALIGIQSYNELLMGHQTYSALAGPPPIDWGRQAAPASSSPRLGEEVSF